jgi:prophage regulatory protein
MSERLLTLKEVVNIVGFKKSTIYKFIKEGKFPKQIKIGHSSRWKLSDIQEWMKQVTSA